MEKGIRKKLLIVLGVIFAIGVQVILTTYSKKDDILCQVFASSNTICKNGRFVMDISVNNKYMTKKDEKGLLTHIGGIAGLSSEEYEYNETDYGGNLKGKNDKVEVLISLKKTDDGDIKILLSIESDNEEYIGTRSRIVSVGSALREFFEKEKMNVLKEYLVLKGEYPGKVSNDFIDKNTKEICDKMEAVVLEQKSGQGIYSVYAYSKKIRESVDVLGEKSNINVVYTYDEENHTTNIYIATPILNEEY